MREAASDWIFACIVALHAFMLGFVCAVQAVTPPKEAAPITTLRGAQR
jgi:hypothetical protein